MIFNNNAKVKRAFFGPFLLLRTGRSPNMNRFIAHFSLRVFEPINYTIHSMMCN